CDRDQPELRGTRRRCRAPDWRGLGDGRLPMHRSRADRSACCDDERSPDQSAHRVCGTAGRNPLLSAKEHMTGTSTEHEAEVPRLHPNVIRNLGIGECCIITNGAYQALRVARLPQLPDFGLVWGSFSMAARATRSGHAAPPRAGTRLPAVLEPGKGQDEVQATELSTNPTIASHISVIEADGDSATSGEPAALADEVAPQIDAQIGTATSALETPRSD